MTRAALAAVASALLATRAAAAEPTAADRALATDLFREGRALLNAGRTAEACRKLEESQRLDPGGGTLLNVALCHEREGRTASAWSEFTAALGMARRDGRADRIETAEAHIRALEAKLSRLVVHVRPEAERDGLVVLRDGTPLGRAAWGMPMPVDPGEHRVEARAEGMRPFSAVVTVGPDADRQEVEIPELEPLSRPEPTPLQPAPRESRTEPISKHRAPPAPSVAPGSVAPLKTAAILVGGAGLALVGVGSVAGVFAIKRRAESVSFDPVCTNDCHPEAVRLNDSAKAAADAATVTIGLGLAAVAASAIVLLTLPARAPAARSANLGRRARQSMPRMWLTAGASSIGLRATYF